MKTRIYHAIYMIGLLFATLTMALGAPSQTASIWKNIGPGGGGWLPCVAVSPVNSSIVYAGCDVGGFYRSTDSGASWKICNTGLHDYYIEVIAPHPKDPNMIYIGTQSGVHKSTNGGKTWKLMRSGFPPQEQYSYSAPIGALVIDPRHPNVLYAGIGRPRSNDYGKGAIYKSTDNGLRWQLTNSDGGGMDKSVVINDLIVSPENSKRLFAATSKGLYRSDDSGVSWTHLDNGLPDIRARRIVYCPARPEIMYASFESLPGVEPRQGGVFRSVDGGKSWELRSKGLETRVGRSDEPAEMTSNIDRLVIDPKNPDIVYAGDWSWVSAGVYKTTDGGLTWTKITDMSSSKMEYGWITMWGPSVMGLAIDKLKPSNLYFTTSGHVFRSADNGKHWKAVYTKSASRSVALKKSLRFWQSTGLEVTCLNNVVVHPKDAKRLFVCYFDIGLLQSFDGGVSFTQTVDGMTYRGNTFTVAFDPGNPEIVYAGTGEWATNRGDICRSEDGGFSWKVVGKPETGLPDGQTKFIVIDPTSPVNSRRIYVSVENNGIYRSDDSGNTWKDCTANLPVKVIRGLIQHPIDRSKIFVFCNGPAGSSGGIYATTDQGKSWQRVSEDFLWSNSTAFAISQSRPHRIYVSSREEYRDGKMYPGGVFMSDDNGITWKQILKDKFIQSLAVDPKNADIIYAGGNDNPYHDEAIGSGVQYSTDAGKTWKSLNLPSLTNHNITSLTINPYIPGSIYAGTGGNGVFILQPTLNK